MPVTVNWWMNAKLWTFIIVFVIIIAILLTNLPERMSPASEAEIQEILDTMETKQSFKKKPFGHREGATPDPIQIRFTDELGKKPPLRFTTRGRGRFNDDFNDGQYVPFRRFTNERADPFRRLKKRELRV